MDWQLKLTNDVVDLVSDSFLLFSDPYHKAVYQLPTTSTDSYEYEYTGDVQSSWLSVRGVPMPTDAQSPVSVSVSAQQAIVYWIDSSARRILSSHFNTDQHRVLVTLPTGLLICEFSCFYSHIFSQKPEKSLGSVPTYYAAVSLQLHYVNRNPNLWPFNLTHWLLFRWKTFTLFCLLYAF